MLRWCWTTVDGIGPDTHVVGLDSIMILLTSSVDIFFEDF